MEETSSPSNVLEFLLVIGQLKTQKRMGWINHNVQLPESISDHMYRMAIMSFLIQDNSINKEKCMKLALVHDMAEAIVGDITPKDAIPKEEKHKRELAAMEEISNKIGGKIGKFVKYCRAQHREYWKCYPNDATDILWCPCTEIFQLWKEYEENETAEAKRVKEFDRFEMIVQALEYEKAQKLNLQDFFDSTKGFFKSEEMKGWVNELYKCRENKE